MRSFEMSPPWDLVNAESIDLTAMVPAVAALEGVPESVARELGVFPVEVDAETLVLAIPKNIEFDALDKIRFVLNRDIRPVLAPEAAIRLAIDLWYR